MASVVDLANIAVWRIINNKQPLFAGGKYVAFMKLPMNAGHPVEYLPEYASMAGKPALLYWFDGLLQKQYINVAANGAAAPTSGGTSTAPPAASTVPVPTASTVAPIPENTKTSINIMGREVPIMVVALGAAAAAFMVFGNHGRD